MTQKEFDRNRQHTITNETFYGLDLSNRNLSQIIFHHCVFVNVSFKNTDLTSAMIDCSRFENCDFSNSNLSHINTLDSLFKNCNFEKADLTSAVLRLSSIDGSDFKDAVIKNLLIYPAYNARYGKNFNIEPVCPKEGSFVAWKRCAKNRIVKLLVPKDAYRINGTSHKCRCSKAKVIEITSLDGKKKYKSADSIRSTRPAFYVSGDKPVIHYVVGETVYPDRFNPDPWHECSNGIHFFMTREEAVRYEF